MPNLKDIHNNNVFTALQILKLKPNASNKQLRKAYRRMAMKTHPDKGGSNEEFIMVKASYDYLNKFGTDILEVAHVPFEVGSVQTNTNNGFQTTFNIRIFWGIRR